MNTQKWNIKSSRPEEKYAGQAEIYFSERVADNYDSSTPTRKTQEKLTRRALEISELEPGVKILDIGCGTGHSTKQLEEQGYEVKGIDLSRPMVEKARLKGLDVQKADMRDLPFEKNEFKGIISISALQWVMSGENRPKVRSNLEKVAEEARRVLKKAGRAVYQFYPKSQEQIELTGSVFSESGLRTEFIVDYPDDPGKRKIYLKASIDK